MLPSPAHRTSPVEFSPRLVVVVTIIFIATIAALNRAVWFIDHHVTHIERAPYWPMGVFEPRSPNAMSIAVSAGCIILFVILYRLLEGSGFRLIAVVVAGLVLIVATSSLHGFEAGFVKPIAGTADLPRIQYFDDAAHIESASAFLCDFNRIQPTLLAHSRTHPPGAVLFFYGLRRLLPGPATIAFAIAGLATLLTALFLDVLLSFIPNAWRDRRGYFTFLLLVSPATEIYYLASLDAVIAALVLGSVALFLQRRTMLAIFGASLCLILASFLTFAALFVAPVLLLMDWFGTT